MPISCRSARSISASSSIRPSSWSRTSFATSSQAPTQRQTALQHLAEGYWGPDPTSVHGRHKHEPAWTERLRLIFVSALQVDKAVFFTAAITVTAFVPLFTMQGVEGQIFGPMARTYGYALAGALLATFTVTPVLASLLLPGHIEETETDHRARAALELHAGAALGARQSSRSRSSSGCVFLAVSVAAGIAARQRIPAGAGGRQFLDQGRDAADDVARCRHRRHRQDARDPAATSGGHHGGVAAWPPRQWQRRLAILQCRIVRAAQAVRRMAGRT